MIRQRESQRGVVLVVSLMILVVLTLLAVTSVSTSTVNLRIVDNMRAQIQAEDATQQAVERVLSNIAFFNDPSSTPSTISIDDPYTSTSGDYTVNLTQPTCIARTPAEGYSANFELAPENTTWVVNADVTGPEGAQGRITQGVEITLTAGNCP